MRRILRKELYLSRIHSCDEQRFSLLWPLYESAFPSHERRSLLAQLRAMRDPQFHCMALHMRRDIVGLLWYWDCAQFTYIEHLATFPSMRGKGLGSMALQHLARRKRRIILEAEPPASEMNKRRIAFYKRCGFHLNTVRYTHRGYAKRACPHDLVIMTTPEPCESKVYEQFKTYVQDRVLTYIDAP
ncbi:MAG: GNAT family N-acetyltransferase [Bradymonadales bacterium]